MVANLFGLVPAVLSPCSRVWCCWLHPLTLQRYCDLQSFNTCRFDKKFQHNLCSFTIFFSSIGLFLNLLDLISRCCWLHNQHETPFELSSISILSLVVEFLSSPLLPRSSFALIDLPSLSKLSSRFNVLNVKLLLNFDLPLLLL